MKHQLADFLRKLVFSGIAIPMGSLIWNSCCPQWKIPLTACFQAPDPGKFLLGHVCVVAIPSPLKTCSLQPGELRFLRWMGYRGRARPPSSWKDQMKSLYVALSVSYHPQLAPPWHSRPPQHEEPNQTTAAFAQVSPSHCCTSSPPTSSTQPSFWLCLHQVRIPKPPSTIFLKVGNSVFLRKVAL